MRPNWGAAVILGLVLALPGSTVATASNSVADRVKDGPAADLIRESLRLLEKAEETSNVETSLALYREGKTLAERAVEIDERDPDAHFALFANWGRILQTDGYLKHAHHLPRLWSELDRAIELDPEHAPALGAKGGLYLRLPWFLGGSIEKAQPLLERAVRADPEIIGARLELAECYIQKERPDPARELATRALEIAKRDGKERYVTRARALLHEIDGAGLTARAGEPAP